MDSLIQDSPGREERPITTRCSGDVEVKGDVGLDPQLATGTRLKQDMGLASLVPFQLLVQIPEQRQIGDSGEPESRTV